MSWPVPWFCTSRVEPASADPLGRRLEWLVPLPGRVVTPVDEDGQARWDEAVAAQLALLARLPQRLGVQALPPVVEWQQEGPVLVRLAPWDDSLARALEEERPGGPRQLIELLVQVAQVLDRAHRLGAVHGRLAPTCVRLSRAGEVQLVGWGRAALGDAELAGRLAAMAPASRGDDPWLAPELGGAAVPEAAADVYAFGELLLRCLALPADYDSERREELLELVRSATAEEPRDRPSMAQVLSILYGWRSQERARRRASHMLQQAESSAAQLRELDALLTREQVRLERLERSSHSWGPPENRAPLRSARRKLELLVAERQRAQLERITYLNRALLNWPAETEARRKLADLHRASLQEAREHGRQESAAMHAALVQLHDFEGRHRTAVLGRAQLLVEMAAPRAEVSVTRLINRDGLLRTAGSPVVGNQKLELSDLQPGHFLVRAKSPDHAPLSLAVSLARGQRRSLCLPLWKRALVPDGFVCVVGGLVKVGGDPRALGGERPREAMLDPFLMAVHPVTSAEYARFLESLWRAGGAARAAAHVPRARDGERLWARGPTGWRFSPRRNGSPWGPSDPVTDIVLEDARAYVEWKRASENLPYDLPTADEWEHAGRTCDDRPFPWGFHHDPGLYGGRWTEEGGRRTPFPVGSFPHDTAPSGVEDMSGGVREFVGDSIGGQAVICGGCFNDGRETSARLASRFPGNPQLVSPRVGFRLVLRVSPEVQCA